MDEYDETVDIANRIVKGSVSFITIDADGVTVACDQHGNVVGVLSPVGWTNYAGDRFAV